MMNFDDIKANSQIAGLIPNEVVTVIAVNKTGENALTVFFRKSDGTLAQQMLMLRKLS